MSQKTVGKETPEERELERQKSDLALLEVELAQGELDLATLQGGLHAFEAHYVRVVGACYVELDELQARLAEAQARRTSTDPRLRQQAADARRKATESASATDAVWQQKRLEQFAPADDLKKLYRDIAKRLHPDLTTDEKDRARRHRLMAAANRAYEDGEEAKLAAIMDEWQSSPESVEGEGIGADLVRTIRKLHQVRKRLAAIATQIAELTGSDLHAMQQRVEAAQTSGHDLLAEMADHLRTQIAFARAQLSEFAARVVTA
jgi:hypothetical protein